MQCDRLYVIRCLCVVFEVYATLDQQQHSISCWNAVQSTLSPKSYKYRSCFDIFCCWKRKILRFLLFFLDSFSLSSLFSWIFAIFLIFFNFSPFFGHFLHILLDFSNFPPFSRVSTVFFFKFPRFYRFFAYFHMIQIPFNRIKWMEVKGQENLLWFPLKRYSAEYICYLCAFHKFFIRLFFTSCRFLRMIQKHKAVWQSLWKSNEINENIDESETRIHVTQ